MARVLIASGVVFASILLFAPSASANGCTLGSCPSLYGAIFSPNDIQPAGTGVIDSFLRVQMKGSEQGFNTDARQDFSNPAGPSAGSCNGTDCDSKTDPNYTRDIQLSQVTKETLSDGVNYYAFFLDVNEPAASDPMLKNWITLDQLEIYGSSFGTVSGSTVAHDDAGGNTGGGSLTINGASATKVYDLDKTADNFININYLVSSSGSGKADMVAYIPVSYFTNAGLTGSSYIYLYSQFGCISGGSANQNNYSKCTSSSGDKFASQAGFEEWFTMGGTSGPGGPGAQGSAVPEPGSLLLLGTGIVYAVRRRANAGKAKIR